MSSSKILVVFGATGNQGSSVVKSILGDPATAQTYHIRAVTRDPSKPAAVALAERGVTVLKADLDDKDSLRAVMKDAYAVFAVTNFHQKMDKDYEMQQGFNIADVAKETNVQHLIWSSLPHVNKISNNKYTKVLHFDGKALVEDHIREIRVPATFLLLGIFMDELINMIMPGTPTATGSKTYKLCLPIADTNKWPLISAREDVGKYVKAILAQREKLLGKQICAAAEDCTIAETVKKLNEGGLNVTFEQWSPDKHKTALLSMGLPEHFVEDMDENVKYISEFGFFGDMTLESGHQILTEPLETFAEWMAKSPKIAAMK